MTLYHLIQAYNFDEVMPVIVDMFPGTSKYEEPLKEAYKILMSMRPVESKKIINYKIMDVPGTSQHYVGAEDRDFDASWEVLLGKNVSRGRGVDLSDIEILANCLVNICFIGRHPRAFDAAYNQLTRPER